MTHRQSLVGCARNRNEAVAMIRTGTAGWSIPRDAAGKFAGEGRHLGRYARVLGCVEINSSFSRPHRRAVYERWAAESAETFQFSVKIPKAITHVARLQAVRVPLEAFISQVQGLGSKLAALLVQLPPTLQFDPATTRDFFRLLGAMHDGAIVCEPRHASWFGPDADVALSGLHVSRVAADPALHPGAEHPGGWLGHGARERPSLRYYRWHGSPQVYRSAYSPAWLAAQAREVASAARHGDCVCIFDNTAAGAAILDALAFQSFTQAHRQPHPSARGR